MNAPSVSTRMENLLTLLCVRTHTTQTRHNTTRISQRKLIGKEPCRTDSDKQEDEAGRTSLLVESEA